MSKEKWRVPKLRFPGFTEDWEQRKFGELFILKSGVAFKLSEYTKTGIPIINGESIKAGKISLEKINYLPNEYQYKYQECLLIPGDIVLGLNRPIIDGTLKISRIPADIKKSLLYQRAGKIIFKVNMDENFTYQLLSKEVLTFTKKEAVGSDQPFITTTKLNKWDLYFPVKDKERRNIGSLFNNIDNIITLHQRKLNNLKLKKKALLQKLFPKNGERYPELRFPGFTDAWEQRKLIYIFNDFIVPMRDKPKVFSGTTPWTRIEDIEGRYINTSLSGQFVSDETIKSMNLKVIPKGSLIVSASATFGVVAIVNNDLITNQTFIGLVPNKDFDIDFLYSLFEAPTTKGKLLKLSAGSTIFYIARESFENLVLSVPSKEEQIKISKVFKSIDDSITLHQRKLDHLQLQKKALLQQMFV